MANRERRIILERYKAGEVSVEEAERLLEAAQGEEFPAGMAPKYIHVQITQDGEKRTKARIPFSLVKMGLKLGKSFGIVGAKYDNSPIVRAAMEALQDLDLGKLSQQIRSGDIALPYPIVEIDDREAGKSDTTIVVVLE